MSDENFLSRWSRRKRAAAAGAVAEPAALDGRAAPAPANAALAAEAPGAAATEAPATPAPLPPLESISVESDFSPFMAREVDPDIQRAALKKLFQDERFNVMDGLDVYIDDYTKPSPIPPEWYAKMAQMAYLGDAGARAEEPEPEAPPAAEGPAEALAPPESAADATSPETDISHNDVSGADADAVPRKSASQ